MGNHLYLFPHQDDEVFAFARIEEDLRKGHTIYICFLTDGTALGVPASRRNAESLEALREWGIDSGQIRFLGSEINIRDGSLYDSLDKVFSALAIQYSVINFDQINAPAWEGGHPDHDATFFLALALAKNGLKKVQLRFYYTYNGWRTFWLFFNVSRPLPGPLKVDRQRLNLKQRLRILFSIRHYRSQFKSWLGLFPVLCLHMIFNGSDYLAYLLEPFKFVRAHSGSLLYERWNRMSFDEFESKTRSFYEREIANESSNKG